MNAAVCFVVPLTYTLQHGAIKSNLDNSVYSLNNFLDNDRQVLFLIRILIVECTIHNGGECHV